MARLVWVWTNIFTVFTKLASQLTADKLLELAVIPVIFIIQTMVSYLVSIGVSKAFGFQKRPANFVTAMGVSVLHQDHHQTTLIGKSGFRKLKLPAYLSRYLVISNP